MADRAPEGVEKDSEEAEVEPVVLVVDGVVLVAHERIGEADAPVVDCEGPRAHARDGQVHYVPAHGHNERGIQRGHPLREPVEGMEGESNPRPEVAGLELVVRGVRRALPPVQNVVVIDEDEELDEQEIEHAQRDRKLPVSQAAVAGVRAEREERVAWECLARQLARLARQARIPFKSHGIARCGQGTACACLPLEPPLKSLASTAGCAGLSSKRGSLFGVLFPLGYSVQQSGFERLFGLGGFEPVGGPAKNKRCSADSRNKRQVTPEPSSRDFFFTPGRQKAPLSMRAEQLVRILAQEHAAYRSGYLPRRRNSPSRWRRADRKDDETIGLRGFPALHIQPIATRFEELPKTCCHLSLDKPTRLPGDYVFASTNIPDIGNLEVVSAPLLPVTYPNRPYALHLKSGVGIGESEFDTLNRDSLTSGAKSYIKALKELHKEKEAFSDHVQVRRSINGVKVYSNNASFVVLNKVMEQETLWGSEEMFVRAVMEKDGRMNDLFLKYMSAFSPPVVGVQEATLSYFIMYMTRPDCDGRTPQDGKYCFFCQTDFEGSAILVNKELVSQTWMTSPNYWFGEMEDTQVLLGAESYCNEKQQGPPFDKLAAKESDVWAVCGHPGRTFSAVVLTLGEQDILMLNVHSPNPAADKVVKFNPPYDRDDPPAAASATSAQQDLDEVTGKNEFERKGYTRQSEWLSMLLLEERDHNAVLAKIRAEYNRCEGRLIIVGDFNDASRVYREGPA